MTDPVEALDQLEEDHPYRRIGKLRFEHYAEEIPHCAIYSSAHFTANKDEYLPIPFEQISASNGHYTQNIGNW